MSRRGDYLYKRKGSQNWWIRFQYTGHLAEKFGTRTEESLGTPDRADAEIRALEHIRFHKEMLMVERNRKAGTIKRSEHLQFPPGQIHYTEEGRFFATESELHYLDDAGHVVRRAANQAVTTLTFDTIPGELPPTPESKTKKINTDDAVIRTWITQKGISGYLEREALAVWQEFNKLTGNKPLRYCTHQDGRALATHLLAGGNKTATVTKKISHLKAATNIAIRDGKLTLNPFSSVIPKAKDRKTRLPLSEADMRLVRKHSNLLTSAQLLFWVILATTGMRRGEAAEIDEIHTEGKIRFVVVGTKTEQSLRRVPLPDAVCALLASKSDVKWFNDTPKNMGRQLLRFMRSIGITDDRKVLHSLRHRAKDRLRAANCPLDVQYQLLGHEEKTVAAGYGVGHPTKKLKQWIEKIGY